MNGIIELPVGSSGEFPGRYSEKLEVYTQCSVLQHIQDDSNEQQSKNSERYTCLVCAGILNACNIMKFKTW